MSLPSSAACAGQAGESDPPPKASGISPETPARNELPSIQRPARARPRKVGELDERSRRAPGESAKERSPSRSDRGNEASTALPAPGREGAAAEL